VSEGEARARTGPEGRGVGSRCTFGADRTGGEEDDSEGRVE
jgi:hypothetical protein